MVFGFPVRKENEEVYYIDDSQVALGYEYADALKKIAAANPSKKARLCIHQSPSADLHEMFIVHGRQAYVRPHRHLKRHEGLMVLEGQADLLTFSTSGGLVACHRLDRSHIHIAANLYHMLIIRSEFLVFYEATTGPFSRLDTEFAPWSPDGSNASQVSCFIANMEKQITIRP